MAQEESHESVQTLLAFAEKNDLSSEAFKELCKLFEDAIHETLINVARKFVDLTPEEFAKEQEDMREDIRTNDLGRKQ